MRKTLPALALAVCTVASLAPARAVVPTFTCDSCSVVAFATKTGFRGVVIWQASDPVAGVVKWGRNRDDLDHIALPLGNLIDQAQVALIEFEEVPLIEFEESNVEKTIYYQVVDNLSGAASPIRSFASRNAYTNYSSTEETYTLNVLVQLDSPDLETFVSGYLPSNLGLEDIARGINVFAERLYDALDGYARIGKVLITDTLLNNPVNLPVRGSSPVCASNSGTSISGTAADFLIQTTVPFDSHTWGGWMIDDPCTGFYIGRLGQLVKRWENDLHLGYIMTHEFMHYAFNAPDLYKEVALDADCNNPAWDGSLMHNLGGWKDGRWNLTELDRSPFLTPCEHGDEPWSWTVLRERYNKVPAATAPKGINNFNPRGNPDGGALDIYILRQGTSGLDQGTSEYSTLTHYTPDDTP